MDTSMNEIIADKFLKSTTELNREVSIRIDLRKRNKIAETRKTELGVMYILFFFSLEW